MECPCAPIPPDCAYRDEDGTFYIHTWPCEGSGEEPAEQGDVLRWLAGVLGAPPPRAVRARDPALRAMRSNKRCCNDRLLASGYTFRYPTYREGYRAVLEGMV